MKFHLRGFTTIVFILAAASIHRVFPAKITEMSNTPEVTYLASGMQQFVGTRISEEHLINTAFDLWFTVAEIFSRALHKELKGVKYERELEWCRKFIRRVFMARYGQYCIETDYERANWTDDKGTEFWLPKAKKDDTTTINGVIDSHKGGKKTFISSEFTRDVKKQLHILFRSGAAPVAEHYSDTKKMLDEIFHSYMKYQSDIEDPSVGHLSKGAYSLLSSGLPLPSEHFFDIDDRLATLLVVALKRFILYKASRYGNLYSDSCEINNFNYASDSSRGGIIADFFCGFLAFFLFDVFQPLVKEYAITPLVEHVGAWKNSKKSMKSVAK